MKRFIHTVTVAALTASVAGCGSPYIVDRGRDAMDVLTATAGLGVGAKARAGPLYAGLLCNHDVVGLRDSAFGYYTLSMGGGDGVALELDTTVLPFCWPYREWVFGYDAFMARQPVDGRRLKADYEASSRVPFVVTEDMRHQYRTHLEVVLGLGLSLRLGLNPGEMIDFLLGWATLDIFEDDLEAQEQLRRTRGLAPRRPVQDPQSDRKRGHSAFPDTSPWATWHLAIGDGGGEGGHLDAGEERRGGGSGGVTCPCLADAYGDAVPAGATTPRWPTPVARAWPSWPS